MGWSVMDVLQSLASLLFGGAGKQEKDDDYYLEVATYRRTRPSTHVTRLSG